MSVEIREVREDELELVLEMNNGAGDGILPVDLEQIRFCYLNAAYFRVAELDGKVAGFLIGFDQDSDYRSSNYQWFRQRYADFLYIDRVVIAPEQRGAGLGRIFYADVTSFAEVRAPQLACEVFLEPRNDVAILFHGTYGFKEVGQRVMEEVGLRVSMLVKELECYSWVKQRWIDGPGLPQTPWLARRQPASSVGSIG